MTSSHCRSSTSTFTRMSFQEVVRMRVFQKSANLLPQYFKEKQFDRPLTTVEEKYAKASLFQVCSSGQKVYIYERTHIPASNPVKRVQI